MMLKQNQDQSSVESGKQDTRIEIALGKFLRARKVFARITEKNLLNCHNTFKMIPMFPDDFQFSGLFQNCPDFSR